MYEKLLKLKQNKKWLYYLLLVPVAVLIVLEIYNKYLVKSTKNMVKEVEKDDKKLKKKQEKLQQKAQTYKEKAKNIEKEINEQTIDKDWHLK